MKTKAVLFILLLASSTLLNAQADFRPGYIIEKTGDTIFGKIDYRGDTWMGIVCTFKMGDKKARDYYPRDIFAYRFIDSKYYVSRIVNEKPVFLEYLIQGEVSVYYLRDKGGDHYYMDKEDMRLTEIPYTKEIRSNGEIEYMYESTRHIGLLNVYMQDAEGFQSRIAKVKKPEHQNMIKLAKDYHHIVCEGEDCIIYEKKQPFLKVNVEVLGGMINFNDVKDLVDKNYFQSGLILNVWMPRTNEKMYLRMGVFRAKLEYLEETFTYKESFYDFPLQLGYLAPSTFRIRPSVSIGLLSPTYSGGILIKISKNINIGVQSWVDFRFDEAPWIPKKLLSYSVMGNLYIEL